MSKTLVIGYGNTLRGDDAAGVRAAELIAGRHPDIDCITRHQLTPELAEQLAECESVFFIDADVDSTQPNARLIEPALQADQPRTHFFSPESLLSLSRALYGRVPSKAYTIGIPASQFEFSEQLSDATQRAVDECAAIVDRLIES